MKYVLVYEPGGAGREHVVPHLPAHRALIAEFHGRGALLMTGAFTNPAHGAMGVFTTREDAEAFARRDPFVQNGLVGGWDVREWNETLA